MRDFNKIPNLKINLRQIILVGMTVLGSVILGCSFLFISKPYAPVFLIAGIALSILIFMFLRKPVWALYFAIFIVLIPASLIPSEINSLLNRAATLIAFVVWAVDFISQKRKLTLTSSIGFMILFILWSTITFTWAVNKAESLTILQTYILRLVLFLFLIAHEIRTHADLKNLMNVLAISGVVLEVISILFIALQGYTPGTRLKVLDINENDLGLSLLITIPGIIWWAMRPTKWSQIIKSLLAGMFLIIAIGLIGLSGSRGGAISIGVTLLTLLFWKSTRKWGVITLLLIVIVFIITPGVFLTTIDRFIGVQGDTALGGREYLWPAAIQLIQDHLLTGVGIGNSPFQVIPYMIDNGAPWVSLSGEPLHNPVLVILAETGFPGLILYLGVLISAIASFTLSFLYVRKKGLTYISPYFELVSSMIIGFLTSWIKGGGAETSFGYFFVLSLLIIPGVIRRTLTRNKTHEYEH
jgi:putative inorganic carbon (hco3(-)) transporter